jgi:hypothetical protein
MRRPRPLAALAMVALIGAGCGSADNGSTGTGSTSTGSSSKTATNREKAMKFAACMRHNGVTEFPDPNASGELTIDEIANRSSVDTNAPAFKQAISACKDLEPPGFTGRTRTAQQQKHALAFAQCMRDNGVKDFPDPTRGEPLIDTTKVPSLGNRSPRTDPVFAPAVDKCRVLLAAALRDQK